MLKTRYKAPGFWNAGLGLFQLAESLTSDSSEKEHLKGFISMAKENLHLGDDPSQASQPARNPANGGDFHKLVSYSCFTIYEDLKYNVTFPFPVYYRVLC